MITSKGIRTEYSFSTPEAIARADQVLALVVQKPGLPARDIGMWCRMSGTTTNLYLGHLEQTGRAHPVKPAKGKGYQWHPGPSAAHARRQQRLHGHPSVNTVRARDCHLPQLAVDPLMAGLFGRRL